VPDSGLDYDPPGLFIFLMCRLSPTLTLPPAAALPYHPSSPSVSGKSAPFPLETSLSDVYDALFSKRGTPRRPNPGNAAPLIAPSALILLGCRINSPRTARFFFLSPSYRQLDFSPSNFLNGAHPIRLRPSKDNGAPSLCETLLFFGRIEIR